MIVAVASGKGGTGKTTVAAGLASVWDPPPQAVDLDVEEPNMYLFLHPELPHRRMAEMVVPVPHEEACTRCRACAEICQFKAITVLGDHLMVFPDMCHGCGGCLDVCPEPGALTEGFRELGEIMWGRAGDVDYLMGRLRVSEAMSPPLMHEVQKMLKTDRDVIIDAPPGVSCPAMAAVGRADVILLVSEPTPFGFHDLKLAREAFAQLGKPMGLVINRAGLGNDELKTYALATGLPVLLEIPFSRLAAETYSKGVVLPAARPEWHRDFVNLARRIRELAPGAGSEAANA
jgi:MinD superfamily P-loop ATPase